MRVLETGEKKGGAGGLFGRAGRNIHRDGRGEEDNAAGIGATQGSGEGDEGRARQRQRTGETGAVVKDSEVVYHLHSLPPCLYCLLRLFSASAVVDTRTQAGTP
jgi:hypothetical protein